MKYRAEIDGLRALAVVPVVFFHAGFEWFSGGYIGVDVFFVISGYLITTILLSDLEQDRFSLAHFYERRARRILPALFVVMLTCIPFAWFWMLPGQMEDFGQSLGAVSLFVSNILFWLESGYFAAASEEKPLLHTWSLAVEEQYYLIFPILLWGAWRVLHGQVVWLIIILAACSLGLSEWGARQAPTANFYLAPSRLWELLAGSLVAVVLSRRQVPSSDGLAAVGLGAVCMSVLIFDDTTPFPSVYTMLPVMGTVLLIVYAQQGSWVARLLRARILVGVGLISYSLYLWHQPLFAFARIHILGPLDNFLLVILILASFLLAFLSYQFVEQPFRRKGFLSRPKIFVFAGASILGFVVLGFLLPQLHHHKFFDLEYTEAEIEAQKDARFGPLRELCTRKSWATCNLPETDALNVLIVGDSHGVDGLNTMMFSTHQMLPPVSYSMSTLAGCPPHLDMREMVSGRYPDLDQCLELNETERFSPDFLNQFDVIVVNTLLGRYNEDQLMAYVRFLKESYLGQVIVFGGTFSFKDHLPRYFNKGIWVDGSGTHIQFDPRLREGELRSGVENLGYVFISKAETFCPNETCHLRTRNDELLSYDTHHLSLAFTRILADRWGGEIRSTLSAVPTRQSATQPSP